MFGWSVVEKIESYVDKQGAKWVLFTTHDDPSTTNIIALSADYVQSKEALASYFTRAGVIEDIEDYANDHAGSRSNGSGTYKDSNGVDWIWTLDRGLIFDRHWAGTAGYGGALLMADKDAEITTEIAKYATNHKVGPIAPPAPPPVVPPYVPPTVFPPSPPPKPKPPEPPNTTSLVLAGGIVAIAIYFLRGR